MKTIVLLIAYTCLLLFAGCFPAGAQVRRIYSTPDLPDSTLIFPAPTKNSRLCAELQQICSTVAASYAKRIKQDNADASFTSFNMKIDKTGRVQSVYMLGTKPAIAVELKKLFSNCLLNSQWVPMYQKGKVKIPLTTSADIYFKIYKDGRIKIIINETRSGYNFFKCEYARF